MEEAEKAEEVAPGAEAEQERLPGEDPRALIVEWYRLDAAKQLLLALSLGATVMALGSLVVATALVYARADPHRSLRMQTIRVPMPAHSGMFRRPELIGMGPDERAAVEDSLRNEMIIGLAGLGFVVVGFLITILGLRRRLAEESFLALRTDGLYFVHRDERVFVPWCDLMEAEAAEGALLLRARDGSELRLSERFAGIEHAELAKRIGAVRRRALFGLIAGR